VPRSARPRKPHRRKPIGRPVGPTMAGRLAIVPHLALAAIERGAGDEQHDHTLAAYLNMGWIAAKNAGRDEDAKAIGRGLEAVRGMRARHERIGRYGLTGEEIQELRAAVTTADLMTGRLRTDQMARAIVEVTALAGFDEDDDHRPAHPTPAPVTPGAET